MVNFFNDILYIVLEEIIEEFDDDDDDNEATEPMEQ